MKNIGFKEWWTDRPPLEPNKRREYWYKEIVDAIGSGGGGGGGGGVLVVGVDMSTMTLNKTWQEIYDAPIAVIKMTMDADSNGFAYIGSVSGNTDGHYVVDAYALEENGLQRAQFIASSASDYPVMNMG